MTTPSSPPPSWYEPPDDDVDGRECDYGAHAFSACPPCCRGVEMEQREEACDGAESARPTCAACPEPLADGDSGGLCVRCALEASLDAAHGSACALFTDPEKGVCDCRDIKF